MNKVEVFNAKEIKLELQKCPKIIQDYVHALERNNERWNQVNKESLKKIKELASDKHINTGGLNQYFTDLEKWEESLYCRECGNDERKTFVYQRSVANGNVHRCKECNTESIIAKKPNEDDY